MHEFLKFPVRIFPFVLNSYANSYVNCVHEIRTKFIILDKLRKNLYEFTRIREGYVMNGLYLLIQDSGGSAEIDDPTSSAK